jgi:hypothetical protein
MLLDNDSYDEYYEQDEVDRQRRQKQRSLDGSWTLRRYASVQLWSVRLFGAKADVFFADRSFLDRLRHWP